MEDSSGHEKEDTGVASIEANVKEMPSSQPAELFLERQRNQHSIEPTEEKEIIQPMNEKTEEEKEVRQPTRIEACDRAVNMAKAASQSATETAVAAARLWMVVVQHSYPLKGKTCDMCRRSKVKCDKKVPCSRCHRKGYECTVQPRIRKTPRRKPAARAPATTLNNTGTTLNNNQKIQSPRHQHTWQHQHTRNNSPHHLHQQSFPHSTSLLQNYWPQQQQSHTASPQFSNGLHTPTNWQQWQQLQQQQQLHQHMLTAASGRNISTQSGAVNDQQIASSSPTTTNQQKQPTQSRTLFPPGTLPTQTIQQQTVMAIPTGNKRGTLVGSWVPPEKRPRATDNRNILAYYQIAGQQAAAARAAHAAAQAKALIPNVGPQQPHHNHHQYTVQQSQLMQQQQKALLAQQIQKNSLSPSPFISQQQQSQQQQAIEVHQDEEVENQPAPIRTTEDWKKTVPNRLANSWMDLTRSRCYNEKRAVAGLVHLAHTALVARKPELLEQLLALFEKHELRFDVEKANSRLNQSECTAESPLTDPAPPHTVATFSSHLRGVPVSECPILYLNVTLGRPSVCDANPIFLENILDIISPEDTLFDICDRIFILDDLPKLYEVLAILISGIANEITVSLRLRNEIECYSGWLANNGQSAAHTYNPLHPKSGTATHSRQMKPIPTEARFRLELSPDASEARYGLCLLPQPNVTHDDVQPQPLATTLSNNTIAATTTTATTVMADASVSPSHRNPPAALLGHRPPTPNRATTQRKNHPSSVNEVSDDTETARCTNNLPINI